MRALGGDDQIMKTLDHLGVVKSPDEFLALEAGTLYSRLSVSFSLVAGDLADAAVLHSWQLQILGIRPFKHRR